MKKITYGNGFSGSNGEFVSLDSLSSEELDLFKISITNRFLATFGMELKSEYEKPVKEESEMG